MIKFIQERWLVLVPLLISAVSCGSLLILIVSAVDIGVEHTPTPVTQQIAAATDDTPTVMPSPITATATPQITETVFQTATPTATERDDMPWIVVEATDFELSGEVGPPQYCNNEHKIMVYVRNLANDPWSVQPFADEQRFIEISDNCTWRSVTHPWIAGAAYLITTEYDPAATHSGILECPPLRVDSASLILAVSECFTKSS